MTCFPGTVVFTLIFFSCIMSAANPASVDKTLQKDASLTIAVMDFIGRGIDSNSALGFSDRFRRSLPSKGRLNVMDPGQMDAMSDESKNQLNRACFHDSCLIERGKLLGASFVIAGTVGKIENLFTFNLRMIQVKTGKTILSILQDFQQPLPEVLGTIIPQLAGKFHDEIIRISFAALEIETSPEKAKLRLNNKEIGLTPLLLPDIGDGKYVLSLSHENYLDVVDSLFLKKGETIYKFINLKPTDAYAKTLHEKNKKKNIRLLQGIGAFGSIVALSVGGYYEGRVRDVVENQKGIIRDYNNAENDADFQLYKQQYEQQSRRFDKFQNRRNIGYIASAIMACGAAVVFLF